MKRIPSFQVSAVRESDSINRVCITCGIVQKMCADFFFITLYERRNVCAFLLEMKEFSSCTIYTKPYKDLTVLIFLKKIGKKSDSHNSLTVDRLS